MQVSKKKRTDSGCIVQPVVSQEGADPLLPAAALQVVMQALPVPSLLRLDTAFSASASSKARLRAAYRHGGGLQSPAVDAHAYSAGAPLLWLAHRGVDFGGVQFELPLAQRCESARKRMSLWSKGTCTHALSLLPRRDSAILCIPVYPCVSLCL